MLEALTSTLHHTTTELHQKAAELTQQSRLDALTGLPNRRAFAEELARVIGRVQRGKTAAAVLLVDLDKFKPVNDIHGHTAGDKVLCEVASRLRSVLRDTDTVARLGGDEFALVLESSDITPIYLNVARRIIAAMNHPIGVGGSMVEVGASVGIAISPQDGVDPAQLLHAADLAMYRVKRGGRGAYCVFAPAMDIELRERADLEADFRRGLAEGEIHPYFQPVIQLRDKSLQGFEILARWHHPTRGVVGPDSFIAVAEEAGLLPDMTYALLRRACAIARHWPEHLFIALNISPVHLKDNTLPTHMLTILAETAFSPHRLEVEITEAALVTEVAVAQAALLAMQQAGIRIALDDFGTGYSNLALLRQLSFDKIKIDRSFVLTMQADPGSLKIIETIVDLSRRFGVVITAEGIENSSVSDDLLALGCQSGQGYFFGKPMPAADLENWAASGDSVRLDRTMFATAAGP